MQEASEAGRERALSDIFMTRPDDDNIRPGCLPYNLHAILILYIHIGRARYKSLDALVLTQDAPPDVTFFRP